MIAITNAAGQTLQLGAGQHLTTKQLAAWLDDDDLPGDYSYPLSVPLTEANRRFVGQSFRPDSAKPRYSMPVTVSLAGVLYRRCTMVYSLQGGKINASLRIDGGEANAKLSKTQLVDVLTTPIDLGDRIDANGQAIKTANQAMREAAERKPGQHPFTFFPVRNEAFWEDSLATGGKVAGFAPRTYVNSWQRLDDGTAGFVLDQPDKLGYVCVPQFYLAWVLEQIMASVGYRIDSDWLASPAVQRLTIVNMTGIRSRDPKLPGHQVVPGLCLPDMSVADLIKAIKGRFGLVFNYDGNDKLCYITQFSMTVDAGAQIDLTPYQTGMYETAQPKDTGYVVSEYFDENDLLYQDATGKALTPPSMTIGKGQEPVALKCGTTQQLYTGSLVSTGKWLVPTVRVAGNVYDSGFAESERFAKDGKRRNAIGLRLLSYYGMQPDTTGALYPFASPDVRNARQDVIGTQALTLRGRFGAWRQLLQAYYYFRDQSVPVTQPLLLPVSILSRLKMHRLVSLTLSRSVTNSYLPTTLEAESPGIDGKAIARIECQTLPSGIGQSSEVDNPLAYLELKQEVTRAEYRESGRLQTEERTKLTLLCWSDKTRTTAVQVTNLVVSVRHVKTFNTADLTPEFYNPANKIEESVQTYTVTGTSAVLETGLLTDSYIAELGGKIIEEFKSVVQLDPDDAYLIFL